MSYVLTEDLKGLFRDIVQGDTRRGVDISFIGIYIIVIDDNTFSEVGYFDLLSIGIF